MSTPQDSQNGQGNGQAWNTPGAGDAGRIPDGQTNRSSQYGQQDNGGQYGYQAAQPSGYAYPSPAGELGSSGKGPVPTEVQRAYYLILAAGILTLVSSIIQALTTDAAGLPGAAVGVVLGLVFAVIFAAVYVLLAVFIRKGQNWARITATVLAGLNALFVLGGLLLLPIASQAAEASGQTMPETPVVSMALSVVVMALGLAGVIMTYLKPARPYFAPENLRY